LLINTILPELHLVGLLYIINFLKETQAFRVLKLVVRRVATVFQAYRQEACKGRKQNHESSPSEMSLCTSNGTLALDVVTLQAQFHIRICTKRPHVCQSGILLRHSLPSIIVYTVINEHLSIISILTALTKYSITPIL